MKKRIAILCALILGMSMLTACGNNSDQTAQDTENAGEYHGRYRAGRRENGSTG